MPLTRVTGNVVKDNTLPESKLINPYVNTSGDTMTGTLYLPANGLIAGTNQLVLSSGYVGIGNAAPQYDLDVSGSVRITGQLIIGTSINPYSISLLDGTSGSPSIYFDTQNNTGIYRSVNVPNIGAIVFSSSGNDSLSIDDSRIINYSGIYSIYRSGSVNSIENAIQYDSGADICYIGRDTSILDFRTSGIQSRLRINSTGQVSIGTANTVAGITLNVSGRINSSGGYAGILSTDLPAAITTSGGTGLTSYSSGDILYYSSGTTLSTLSAPASRSLLSINNSVPNWISIPLSIAYGGTGITEIPSDGQVLIGNGTSFRLNTISPGNGISITNGSGTIAIGVTSLPNSSLLNSSITINTSNGLSGGGTISLGETLTLVSTGVTSLTAGTGVSLSGSSTDITISNSGVISVIAGSGISISDTTGIVAFSLDSNISPTFTGLSLSNNPLNIISGGTGLSSTPLSNQILCGNGIGGYDLLSLIGVGISITPDYNAKVLTFTSTGGGGGGGFTNQIINGSSKVEIPVENSDIVATVGNVEVLRLSSSNIGIGTTNPSAKIDFGAGNTNERLIGLISNTSTNNFTGIGLSPLSEIRIAGYPSSINLNRNLIDFGCYSSDGNYTWASSFVITNSGKVGIGTTNPYQHLDVNGDICTRNTIRYGTGTTTIILAESSSSRITTTSTSQSIIDFYDYLSYRTCKYLIQIRNTDNNLYQSSELIVTHDATVGVGTTNAYITEYAIVNSGINLGSFDANISFGNIELVITPTYANNIITIYKTIITY